MFEPSTAELRARHTWKWLRYPPDVLPAWVADMDFAPAPPIVAAIRRALERGDLGYPTIGARSGVQNAFAAWAAARWGWAVDVDLVHLLPDVVKGLENAIEAFSAPGDAIAVPIPIYPPFLKVIDATGRTPAPFRLGDDGTLGEAVDAIARSSARVVLFCNPHNPTGHVFTAAELGTLGRVVAERDLILVSDEIHADLVYPGYTHRPFATVEPAVAARTLTLTSPSKAFNVAGLRLAVAISGSPSIHDALFALPDGRRHGVGTLGVEAALAAWSDEGRAWLDDCRRALLARRDRVTTRLATSIGYRPPEATYLAWLDCRALDLGVDPQQFFLERARVALSAGPDFGPPGAGFARLNFATATAVLDEILDRLAAALA